MDHRTDVYVYMLSGLGRGCRFTPSETRHQHEGLDLNDGVRAYSRKVKADKAAITNYDNLPRPKRPPGR